VLRITGQHTPERTLLKLEGRLTGVWVPELEASWRGVRESYPDEPIWIDLCDVDVVDTAGRYLLALMHDSGSQFVARGCAMSELVREITGGWPVKT
jgi:anti-anti-sigma regulatory factor